MKTNRTGMFAREAYLYLAALLVLSGCSWMTRFAVTNSSDAPVKLIISAVKAQNGICTIADWAPLEITFSPLNRWSANAWQKLTQDRYTLDRQHCVAEIEILPGESVSVTKEPTYTGHRREGPIPGQLSSLTIQSKDGEISSKGWEITKRFEWLDNSLYVYSYK